jgi:DNA-binding SARP family transcriptional activator
MKRLCLHLLGAFRVTLDGEPVNNFRTQKTRALLAYLAVEARPHERDHLAGLFWPEWPDAVARTYVRQALTNLRRLLERDPGRLPLLLADNHTLQIDPAVRACDLWLDTAALADALSAVAACKAGDAQLDPIARLEEAAALYRGISCKAFVSMDVRHIRSGSRRPPNTSSDRCWTRSVS